MIYVPNFGKDQLFWEECKTLAQSACRFWHNLVNSNIKFLRQIAPNFCGLLRKAELYVIDTICINIVSNCWKGHLWRIENSNKISQSTKVKSCNLELEIFVQYPPSTLFFSFLASNFLWLKRTCLIKLISLSIHHFLSTLIEACV